MHASLQFFLNGSQSGSHPVSTRQPLELEDAPGGPTTDMSKPKEVKCLRSAKTSPYSASGRITAKLDQSCLVRMQRQRELFHSLPHIRHEASGFTFVLETDDDIIGVAHYDDLTPAMALAPPVCPEIEDVMEVDI